jgi:hypothetical protein
MCVVKPFPRTIHRWPRLQEMLLRRGRLLHDSNIRTVNRQSKIESLRPNTLQLDLTLVDAELLLHGTFGPTGHRGPVTSTRVASVRPQANPGGRKNRQDKQRATPATRRSPSRSSASAQRQPQFSVPTSKLSRAASLRERATVYEVTRHTTASSTTVFEVTRRERVPTPLYHPHYSGQWRVAHLPPI